MKLKQWLDKLNKNNGYKIKTKFYFFWNKRTFPPLHCMIEGNYLEQHKEIAGGNLHYIYYKSKALISAFCIVRNYSTPPTITEKKWSGEVEMFLINHDMH